MKKGMFFLILLVSIVSERCSYDDPTMLGSSGDLVQADAFIRTIDGGTSGLKHAPAFFVYSILPMKYAEVFFEGKPETKISLNRIDDFTFGFYQQEKEYSTFLPKAGRYQFNIELSNGRQLVVYDELLSLYAVPVKLESPESAQSDISVKFAWKNESKAEAFKLKLYTVEGNLRYESDLLGKTDTVFQVRNTDPNLLGAALENKQAYAVVEAYLFENENVRLVNLQGVSVSAPLYFNEK
jgi:hypothetical protein